VNDFSLYLQAIKKTAMLRNLFFVSLFLSITLVHAQKQTEVTPPYNIKTVSFVQSNENKIPIFQLGEGFQLQFDDLFGNEANYYYEIVHCDYNWIVSNIPKNEYLEGFDSQRIRDYTNSFNTLQLYSHYRLPIPNQNTTLKISGNYILKILNEDKEVVFSKKFIVYEDLVSLPTQVRRARKVTSLENKQNLEFSIKSTQINFQNPLKNVKVVLLQNGQFNGAITNIAPQYTLGNDLIYKYDTETQFWAGNEFLYFDNKEIRVATNNISRITSENAIYSAFLYTNQARKNIPYSNREDVNGNFVIRNLRGSNNEIEADYSWVYFSLSAPTYRLNKGVYITGMFNNYSLTSEYKMDYNEKNGLFEKAVLIKQGFTNFQYTIADDKGNIDSENAIDGNFYQTENQYKIRQSYRKRNSKFS
jgi:Domain of unknown function (DUF5103)